MHLSKGIWPIHPVSNIPGPNIMSMPWTLAAEWQYHPHMLLVHVLITCVLPSFNWWSIYACWWHHSACWSWHHTCSHPSCWKVVLRHLQLLYPKKIYFSIWGTAYWLTIITTHIFSKHQCFLGLQWATQNTHIPIDSISSPYKLRNHIHFLPSLPSLLLMDSKLFMSCF